MHTVSSYNSWQYDKRYLGWSRGVVVDSTVIVIIILLPS
jgi:hypothetical protein